jgi:hypothetical protein
VPYEDMDKRSIDRIKVLIGAELEAKIKKLGDTYEELE